MASPQKEKGYTAISNELLEVVVRTPLPGRHKDILFFVMRKTYGYNKKRDRISLSQFVMGTAIDRSSVCRIIKDLVSWNLLMRDKGVYSINKDYETWVVAHRPLGVVACKSIGSGVDATKSSGVDATYKRKKDNVQKTLGETGSPLLENNHKDMPIRGYNENQHQDELPSVGDNGEIEVETRKKSPCYEVYGLFKETLGIYPKIWDLNRNQRKAAEILMEERKADGIRRALEFYLENKDDKFCPVINSPWDLANKWKDLFGYKTRNNL